MNIELKNYSESKFELQYLKDAFFICSGLYERNHSIDTKIECEHILTDLYKVNYLIKTSYPYMHIAGVSGRLAVFDSEGLIK